MDSLDQRAFADCAGLKNVVLPSTIKSLGNYVFNNSGTITCLIEENGVTALPEYMLSNCARLTGVTIPEGITSIGSNCFRSNSLTEIVYPSTITQFGTEVHLYSRLTTFVIKAVTPPAFPTGLRLFTYGSSPYIYVPDDSVNDYKAANGWSSYASRIRPMSEYTES